MIKPAICLFAASAILFTLSIIHTWYTRRQLRAIMNHMNQMLDDAAEGVFQEQTYNESLLSSVETRLAHYLAASEVSAKNLAKEKDTVKQLITDISHQTKTPIANLLLYAQMLDEQELPQETQIFVDEINRQAQKLNFLIISMVKTSRLENKMLILHPKQHDVSVMLQEIISQIIPKAKQKKLTVIFQPENLSAYFDPKWTLEAIYNIADNAVKYTPEGGTICFSLLDTELFVRIEIRDSGIGIPEEDTAKIFHRFYRSACVSDQEGVGIGLYLSRQIISEENGYIRVKSKPGSGTSFFVYLPSDHIK